MTIGDGRGTGMRPLQETIPLDEAIRRVTEAARPIDRTVEAPIAEAGGRVLAADLVAPGDVPPFDRAAMDGYAVVAADTAGAGPETPVRLRCVASVHTGDAPAGAIAGAAPGGVMAGAAPAGGIASAASGSGIAPGACIQIATGAPLPAGADAVVMVERTDRRGDEVSVFAPVASRQHVGPQGADIKAGQTVLRAGDRLTPGRVGAAAALGPAAVTVYDRPRVGLLSTGDEIVEPGEPLAPGRIYDVNRFTVGALAAAHGGTPDIHPVTGDDHAALDAAVDALLARGADILVFSGGSSVGERDLTLDVLRRKGTVTFHGIAVKPGKPTAFGRIGTTPVLGLPGYPASCLSNAVLLLVPLLRRTARLPPHRPRVVTAPAAHRFVSVAARRQIYTVRLVDGAAVGAFKASGDITSMSQADGYVDIPAGIAAIDAGAQVDVTLFDP